jgi:hypothetical protein
MDKIALGGKALAHLSDGISLLHLLVSMAALVGDFYDKFRHLDVLWIACRGTTLGISLPLQVADPSKASSNFLELIVPPVTTRRRVHPINFRST